MDFTNAQIAKELRGVAAALNLKGSNFFQIRAYETAADAIEHATSEVKDLWSEGKLSELPGVGENLQAHLGELFTTGKVKHWETIKKGLPEALYTFLDVPGIGPKTALKLAEAGVVDTDDLKEKIESNKLAQSGISDKLAEKITLGLKEKSALQLNRTMLPYASASAEAILNYLSRSKDIKRADALGSLRRMVATVGDLDFAIAADDHQAVIEYIAKFSGIKQVIEQGEDKMTAVLSSGLHLDFLIVNSNTYGSLLQHFTGSKHHNIHLRKVAEGKGFSLSEHGIKELKTGKTRPIKNESEIYQILGMQTPPPELREDTGEVEASMKHQLPKLIELKDIKGDFHLHSNFPIEPSHDLGADSIKEIADYADKMGYNYIGSSDHQPSVSNHTQDRIMTIVKRRKEYIDQLNTTSKKVRVLNLLEVDILPNGELAIPDSAIRFLDFMIVGIHSLHRMEKDKMTKRIMQALKHSKAKILSHPTGRLLNERPSYEADWEEVFKFAANNNIAMEINAFPNRLDLPDVLVRMAKGLGVKFTINTDSHAKEQMENMKYGVAVARRGWLEDKDVINSWDFKKVKEWFKI